MSLSTCNTSWMNFSQEIILILHIPGIGRHKFFMLGEYSIRLIQHQGQLMAQSLHYILNGGTWCASCNGTMQKDCFFLLLSLTGFSINFRYLNSILYDNLIILSPAIICFKKEELLVYLMFCNIYLLSFEKIYVFFRKKSCLRFCNCYCLSYMAL